MLPLFFKMFLIKMTWGSPALPCRKPLKAKLNLKRLTVFLWEIGKWRLRNMSRLLEPRKCFEVSVSSL
jgi:hypothetical protein